MIKLVSRYTMLVIVLVSSYFIVSCEKIIEENISKKQIDVLSPADSLVTYANAITFWWEQMKGADAYRLQIVKPDLEQIAELVLDTLVSGNKFLMDLSPGHYQWRIRAENSAYESDYYVRTLVIDTTSDLSLLAIFLSSPIDGLFSSETEVTFEWQDLGVAEDFRFELLDASTLSVFESFNTGLTSYTTQLGPGEYVWRVRGQNSFSNTPFTSFNLTIDTLSPAAAINIEPSNEVILLTDTVTLKWLSDVSSIKDSVFIYNDSMLQYTLGVYGTSSDSLKYVNSIDGDYFWQVRSYDRAGNGSLPSQRFKFTLQ